MLQKSWVTYLCCAVVLMLAVVLVGCPAQNTDQGAEMPPPDLPVDEDMEAEGDGDAEEATFEWTAEPTIDMIPSGPIRGEMNGSPFEAKTVRIEKDDDGTFELTISNTAVEGEDPTEMITGDDAWQLTFSGAEGQTGEWTWTLDEEKEFEQEHVYYWYQQEDDAGPMSINYSWAGALQIDEWTMQEPDPNADTFSTILGNVTGKIALVMDDDEKSWVAGEFDAVYYEW